MVEYSEAVAAIQRWRLRRLSAAIRQFKDIYKGQRCFIIGNGPSIRNQKLDLLANEVTYASNLFVLHPLFSQMRLKYLCLSDPKFWDSGFLEPSIEKAINDFPDLFVFAECDVLHHKQTWQKFPSKRSFVYSLDKKNPVYDGHFQIDPTLGTCHGHTVIIDICIPLAFYMGCSDIYLVGCDCDYRLSDAPTHEAGYFYDIKAQKSRTGNIDYLRNDWARLVFASYDTVNKYANRNNKRILNATAGGKLEVFPRFEFEALFR